MEPTLNDVYDNIEDVGISDHIMETPHYIREMLLELTKYCDDLVGEGERLEGDIAKETDILMKQQTKIDLLNEETSALAHHVELMVQSRLKNFQKGTRSIKGAKDKRQKRDYDMSKSEKSSIADEKLLLDLPQKYSSGNIEAHLELVKCFAESLECEIHQSVADLKTRKDQRSKGETTCDMDKTIAVVKEFQKQQEKQMEILQQEKINLESVMKTKQDKLTKKLANMSVN